jgi:hypothetical protein
MVDGTARGAVMSDLNKSSSVHAVNGFIAIEGDDVPLPPPPMKKPRTVAAVGGIENKSQTPSECTTDSGANITAKHHKFNARQIRAVRALLRHRFVWRSDMDGIVGTTNSPYLIQLLRELGIPIETERISKTDRDGKSTKPGRYSLGAGAVERLAELGWNHG